MRVSANPTINSSLNHLRAENLCCIRGDRQLFSGLDLSVASGELLYLQGANGSGKTTLLRSLCGLFLPDAGDISWNGTPTHQLEESFYRNLLYFGHHAAIKLELTALENLRLNIQLGGCQNGSQVHDDALWAALADVGLSGFEDLPCKMLSQGQKRRVALARLLVDTAPLWILDEPFTALDVAAVEMLQKVIAGHVERGGLVILTTHQEVALTSGQVKHVRLGRH